MDRWGAPILSSSETSFHVETNANWSYPEKYTHTESVRCFQCNPFRDAIYKLFSSERDGRLSFEDILDLCSAFSANCPQSVRTAWAFEIFGKLAKINWIYIHRHGTPNLSFDGKYLPCIVPCIKRTILWSLPKNTVIYRERKISRYFQLYFDSSMRPFLRRRTNWRSWI